MNKPIIIDGVDVSECEFCMHECFKAIPQCKLNIDSFATACMQHQDCYYKQIQRLKAENEKMKAFKRECLKPVCFPDIEPEVINKYKQALEDVREIAKKYYLPDKKLLATGIGINPYGAIIEIQEKINEVLKDE